MELERAIDLTASQALTSMNAGGVRLASATHFLSYSGPLPTNVDDAEQSDFRTAVD